MKNEVVRFDKMLSKTIDPNESSENAPRAIGKWRKNGLEEGYWLKQPVLSIAQTSHAVQNKSCFGQECNVSNSS
jgi:hypothetical protein